VIAATNRDPKTSVREQRLREDLYYRLNVLALRLPPLRERKEDIPALCEHFLAKHAARMGKPASELSAAALQKIESYDWPGNVRELENVIERAVVLNRQTIIGPGLIAVDMGVSSAEDSRPASAPVQTGVQKIQALKPQVEALERQLIAAALEKSADNKATAARLLEISERALWYKLKKYGLGA
jgi:two-component system, NtrC family, response regulator AtoC